LASLIELYKLQAAGNSVVFARGSASDITKEEVIRILDRRLGIGGDNLLFYNLNPEGDLESNPHCIVDGFNNDGSRVGLCANGARLLAWHIYEAEGLRPLDLNYHIVMDGKPMRATVLDAAKSLCSLQIDMPLFDPEMIPYAGPSWTGDITICGHIFKFGVANVGNPHCVLFMDKIPDDNFVNLIGSSLHEDLNTFPLRVNTEFCVVAPDGKLIEARIYERGVGITTSSGSGSFAIAAVAHKLGLARQEVVVRMPGGEQLVTVDTNNGVLRAAVVANRVCNANFYLD
jgi:diaminopimelate epimerase